jgi:Fe2+ or Zn2+ uptake regulation protein
MTCTTHLTEELRFRGFRITSQRRAILSFLHETPGHHSPASIFEHVSRIIPGVTEATVYRTLDFLARNGMVMSSLQQDGHLVYEDATLVHHHMICRDCGVQVSVEHELVHDLHRSLEAVTGFDPCLSHVTFFGLCPICRKKKKN